MSKRVAIIGAGPAGLTAAYELLSRDGDCQVTVFEKTADIGGISKTVEYNGNRMDMGGHRFFSKVPEVNRWWQEMLPLQGSPAKDDGALGRPCELEEGGEDPESTDEVMLLRRRISRIFYDDRFFDYPISLKVKTLRTMGLKDTCRAGFSYLGSMFHKLPEDNLENFYINRFGKQLYRMFFENYTEKLWGMHPREIDASWGAQRVKGLSISAVLKDAVMKKFGRKHTVETSLIDQFQYPKLGPGQLWEMTAKRVEELGGKIITEAEVVSFSQGEDAVIASLTYVKDGDAKTADFDVVVSSMLVRDLIAGLERVPGDVAAIAQGLLYRDYMTLGVLVKGLELRNETTWPTVGDIIPDCWVYVQDDRVKMGRFQVYNNWSPYMVQDLENTVWLGLEYFVNEGDEYWNMSEAEFSSFAIDEVIQLGLIEDRSVVLDTHLERVEKAYPAYFGTYDRIDEVIAYLNSIENLYCVGRNGQHRYNNIDHSMCTSFEAVDNILSGVKDKSNIWSVNTEQQYHEEP